MIIKDLPYRRSSPSLPLFTDVQRVAQLVKNPPAIQGTPVRLLGREDLLGCPGGSAGKESACSAGDLGPMPGLERSS